jgi:hypothetical protein
MKKIMMFLFVLLVAAIPAAAQSNTPASVFGQDLQVTVRQGDSFSKIVESLSNLYGFDLVYRGGKPQQLDSIQLTPTVFNGRLDDVLQKLCNSVRNTVYCVADERNNSFIVGTGLHTPQAAQKTQEQAQTSPEPAGGEDNGSVAKSKVTDTTESGQRRQPESNIRRAFEAALMQNTGEVTADRVDELMARYPHAFNEDGTVGEARQAMLLNRELGASRSLGNFQPTYVDRFGYGAGYPSMAYGRNWNGLPYFVDLLYTNQSRRLDYAWSTARIKIKGENFDRDFLGRISVVALVPDEEGGTKQYVVGDANQHNNWFDKDIIVPIYNHAVTLVFVMEDGSQRPKAFGRTLWLEPQAVSRGATPIVVTADKLAAARDQYDLLKHQFIETDARAIVRTP